METRKQKTKLLVAILLVGGLLLFTLSSNAGNLNPPGPPGPTMKTLDEVEARTPIKASDLPLTISSSGSYYVTETVNFSEPNTNGITINASDVTIDLNGYALIGLGKTVGDSGHGIFSGSHRITVLNGSVCNWRGSGIFITGRCNQVRDVKAAENGSIGILTGKVSRIKGCTTWWNSSTGIQTEPGCTVSGCATYNNGQYGIWVYQGSTVSKCTAYSNDSSGIGASEGSVITGCTAYDNDSYGIDASDSLITSNTCIRNDSANLNLSDCTASNNHAPLP